MAFTAVWVGAVPAGSTIGIGRVATLCSGGMIEEEREGAVPVVVSLDATGVSIVTVDSPLRIGSHGGNGQGDPGLWKSCRFRFPSHGGTSLETRGFCYPAASLPQVSFPPAPGSPQSGPTAAKEFPVDASYPADLAAVFRYLDPVAGVQEEWSLELSDDGRTLQTRLAVDGAGRRYLGTLSCRPG
jgi:hypothetical protein